MSGPAPLAPLDASGGTACSACGGPLAPDQRYCLACGQPASPVRLAFLDVLQAEPPSGALGGQGVAVPGLPSAVQYAIPPEPDGLLGALRRYAGLLALTGVLLAALLIGLLVGHWAIGGSGAGSGKQVIEVKGLGGALAAAPATASSGANAPGASPSGDESKHAGAAKSEAKEEAKEVKEVKAAKAPPPIHKKTSSQSLQKLNKTTGRQHAKEVNELIKGDEPIETGQ